LICELIGHTHHLVVSYLYATLYSLHCWIALQKYSRLAQLRHHIKRSAFTTGLHQALISVIMICCLHITGKSDHQLDCIDVS